MVKENYSKSDYLNESIPPKKSGYEILDELKKTRAEALKIREKSKEIRDRIGERRNTILENLSYKGIERRLKERRIIPILFFVISLFFLSTNVTGFVIGNLNKSNFNWIGGLFFVFGLVGLYFWKKD